MGSAQKPFSIFWFSDYFVNSDILRISCLIKLFVSPALLPFVQRGGHVLYLNEQKLPYGVPHNGHIFPTCTSLRAQEGWGFGGCGCGVNRGPWKRFLVRFCSSSSSLHTTSMGTAGGYNGGNGAATEGREGRFPEKLHIIGSNSGGTPPTYRFPSYA